MSREDEPAALTIGEFCQWADPPITPAALKALIYHLRIAPAGKRPTKGRPANTYDAAVLMALHSDLIDWLVRLETL